MNQKEFLENLNNLGINLNEEQINKLEVYKEYLKEYNKHTNLTAIKEDNEIYLKHFYDSITIIKSIDLTKYNSLLDIGTGAGFPGMVIKIVFNNLKVTLLDSNNKKTKFLENLANKLQIDVKIINDRCEKYAKNNLNTFDIVTSRAVANLRVLSELSLPLVKKNGYFIALKGSIDDNLEDAIDTINFLGATIHNKITFNLYKNDYVRNIIVIKKLRETTKSELRPYDKIIKKPLKKLTK